LEVSEISTFETYANVIKFRGGKSKLLHNKIILEQIQLIKSALNIRKFLTIPQVDSTSKILVE